MSGFDTSFVQVAELFNIFTGLMLTTGIMVFLGGLMGYFARLGTWPSYRDKSLRVMEWGVVILFVLVVILGIVHYFETYPVVTSTVVAIIIIIWLAVTIMRVSAKSGGEGE